jgi:hypothetical protein
VKFGGTVLPLAVEDWVVDRLCAGNRNLNHRGSPFRLGRSTGLSLCLHFLWSEWNHNLWVQKFGIGILCWSSHRAW